MTKPIRFEHLKPCIEWWDKREETEVAWKVTIEQVKERSYNLDVKNPHVEEENHGNPAELLAKLEESKAATNRLRDRLKAVLQEALLKWASRHGATTPRFLFHIDEVFVATSRRCVRPGKEPMTENEIAKQVMDAAFLLKSVLQEALLKWVSRHGATTPRFLFHIDEVFVATSRRCVRPGKEPMTENEIAKRVMDVAFLIHRELGPGLLETVYEVILARKLNDMGLGVERQVPVSIQFEGITFDEGFRADLIVEKKVIIEMKSVERLQPVHAKQLLTYLRLTKCRLGLLINFGENLLKDGFKRVVNGLDEVSRNGATPQRIGEKWWVASVAP
jgi:GxxExxY protein